MIRTHWEEVEGRARDRLDTLKEMALPKRRKLTEREQLSKYLSRGSEDYQAMMRWLVDKKGSAEEAQKEFDKYVMQMEKIRSKYDERK